MSTAIRFVLVILVAARTVSCSTAISTDANKSCALEPAQRLIERLNERGWREWTVSELVKAFPELRASGNGQAHAVKLFELSWMTETTDACTCCSTLAIPMITDTPGEMPHLSMLTLFHSETEFSRAVETARTFVKAANQPKLATHLNELDVEGPVTIDDAVEVDGQIRQSTLRLFKSPAGWYWQYQESRVRSPALRR